jgi:hypothetical protein
LLSAPRKISLLWWKFILEICNFTS